ncbi:hypothetical protein CKAH01_16738 [Colletotrichum kahawae]|uniref:Uncharacterized protein n=1 Tax=Colletotrichum kahawae TaxID=34407 RepID=A0AAD9YEN3_COLKA|nr:hypothetical protein CKAH01_16738 [Colletotrichum kahawae]
MYPIHVLAAILAVTGTGMALPLEESIALATPSTPPAPVVEQPKESWAGCDDPDYPKIPSKKEPFMFQPKKALQPKKPKGWCGREKRDLAMDATWVVDEDGFRTLSPESIAAIFDAAPGPVVPESTPDVAASAAPKKDAGDKILLPDAIKNIHVHGPGIVAPSANTTTSRTSTSPPATTSPATATATGNSTATATGTPTAADSSPTETPLETLFREGPEIKMAVAMLTACSIPTNETNAPRSPLEHIWSLFWKMFRFRPWAINNTKEDATQKCMIKAYNTWLRKMGTAEPTTTPDDITEENASPIAIDCLPELSKAVQERRDNGMVSPATVNAGGECIEEAYEDWMEDLRLSQEPAAEPTGDDD